MPDAKVFAPLAALFCALPVVILTTVIFTIIPFYFFIVGIIKIDGCPAEWRLPVWMITLAVAIILERVLLWILRYSDRKYEALNTRPNDEVEEAVARWAIEMHEHRPKSVRVLLTVARFAVTILTCVGVLLSFSMNFDKTTCDGWIYYPAFYYSLFSVVLSVLTILFGCAFAVFGLCVMDNHS